MTLKRQSSYLSTRPSKSGNEPKPFFTMNRSRPPFVSLSLILPCKITTSFSTSCRREVCLASIACISERSIPTVTLSSSFVAMVSTQLRAYAPSSATMQDGYGGCAILFLSQRMSVSRIVCCEQTERREKKNATMTMQRRGVLQCFCPILCGLPCEPGTHYRRHRWALGRFPSSSTCSGLHLASWQRKTNRCANIPSDQRFTTCLIQSGV